MSAGALEVVQLTEAITDVGLACLAAAAPRLREADLRACRAVTACGLGQLLAACPALRPERCWGYIARKPQTLCRVYRS